MMQQNEVARTAVERPLNGKVAVVTGAGQGIGLGIAEALFAQGASVMLADIDGELVRAAAAGLAASKSDSDSDDRRQALAMVTDVASQAAVASLFDHVMSQLGRVDIVVNNAGMISKTPTIDLTEAQFQRVLDVNLKGVLFGCQEAARRMGGHGGSIINIASVAAHASAPETAAYSVSKSAVLALTRVMAVEWGARNIRVNSVSPTGVDTAMGAALRARDPEGFARRARRVPLQRAAQVADIANAVLFFASDASGFVTGQDLLVDGGLMLQNPGFVV
ncbi:SDR family NAD(P)-dependent oxidoreductase [Duganella hordei]|uniref:SDR family NAD(P)-dependent oxidoreductase n=1 Tax=Duganella hordei TaxID=2865934 RepID=UPI003341052A